MQSGIVQQLRSDFASATLSDGPALDRAIADLREKISAPEFLMPFSIFSRSYLRGIDSVLGRISHERLREDPLQVAIAVESILHLLDRVEHTVDEFAASQERIAANRVS